MTDALDPSLQDLNDCGCCEGIAAQTPVEVYNRPGLSAIAYRVGIHPQFKQSLLASLSNPALQGLTTREEGDFAIALLNAWATVADVLTFYQERIANESYLRTATERVSLLHLARLIGYELRPGVAASTYLAFAIEDAPGSPGEAIIDIGTKVQSVPGLGEQPQTFEAVEKIEARAEWNAIKPRLTQRHPIKGDTERLLFEGIATALKPGDGLLLVPDDGSPPVFRQVAEVILQATQQLTEVLLQPATRTGASFISRRMIVGAGISPPASRVVDQKVISALDFQATARIQEFDVSGVFAHLRATRPQPPSIIAFRTRAAIFGHNAPKWNSLPNYQEGPYSARENSWAETNLDKYYEESESDPNLPLDNVYASITKKSWVVLKDGTYSKHYQVTEVVELTKSDFALSAKITRLTLDNSNDFEKFGIRTTTVFAQSEELKLARLPNKEPVSGSEIELDSAIESLAVGQAIILCGELFQNRGNYACEQATLARVDYVFREREGFTKLTLSKGLGNDYVRNTVTINANVVLSTHGETVREVLGSGDASQPYQSFTLRQPPLTYVSASTPRGAASTLQVRVNDLLWHEVPTLYGKGAEERVYVTRHSDDSQTTIVFGSRLSTGQENVRATYRKGIGLGGLVEANQLSQLMTRPLGVKGVTNPQSATGAEDPESLAQARRNAPLTVLTLDRIVSLQDYEDFARAFGGIAKARATWTWNGQQRGVFVTVAGPNGAEVEPDSSLFKNLLSQMHKAGDRYVPLQVKSYRPAFFRIKARVKIDSDYLSDKVLAAAWLSLQTHFSFDARAFGQGVALSEAIAMIQAVPGVVAVDVDKFYRFGETEDWQPRLAAAAPQAGADGTVAAAELLLLDPNSPSDSLEVIT